MPDRILALFCHVDDFCQAFVPGGNNGCWRMAYGSANGNAGCV
jgi:hypothetical protein